MVNAWSSPSCTACNPSCVANSAGDLENLFYFSVETLTTVGYGELFPADPLRPHRGQHGNLHRIVLHGLDARV